jgi:UDP-N-acetyl-D-mannosaminuronate dehydrogenase
VAETAKLHENTFRAVNIALANELALMCDKIGVDVWEVISAASTKPFGFLPHYPGPGLGGDCIPTVPHFLSWRLRQAGYSSRMIEAAHEVNAQMPLHAVQKVIDALNDDAKPVRGSRILLLGDHLQARCPRPAGVPEPRGDAAADRAGRRRPVLRSARRTSASSPARPIRRSRGPARRPRPRIA